MEQDVRARAIKAIQNRQRFDAGKLTGYPVRDPKQVTVNRLNHLTDRQTLNRLLAANKVRYVVMSHGDIPIAWVTTDGQQCLCLSTFGKTVTEHKTVAAEALWPSLIGAQQ